MDEYLSEKEQIEQIKQWWKENGNFVIAGIVLGVAILVGWNSWKSAKRGKAEAASRVYAEVVAAADDQDRDRVVTLVEQLRTDYASTPYLDQGLLTLAKLYVEEEEYSQAAAKLQELVETTADDQLAKLGRTRWARLHLQMGNGAEALKVLSGEPGDRFAGLYHEIRGDAHAMSGDFQQAAQSYEDALAASMPGMGDRSVLEMKLKSLPLDEQPEPPAETQEQDAG